MQVTFAAVVILYSALGIATLLVLRTLARRWAAADAAAGGRDVGDLEADRVPYGPRRPSGPPRSPGETGGT